jgi:hypothetical protein
MRRKIYDHKLRPTGKCHMQNVSLAIFKKYICQRVQNKERKKERNCICFKDVCFQELCFLISISVEIGSTLQHNKIKNAIQKTIR